jgi:DNA-binding MarR family transcriptional regulator
METVSMVMRAIRHEMRKHRPVEMSVQQFRALGVVEHHPGASMSVVASRLGLTTASASKLIDALVKPGLVSRTDAPEDRRKVVLDLTEAGRHALGAAREAALGRLAEMLAALDESDRLAITRAMDVLRRVLTDEDASERPL